VKGELKQHTYKRINETTDMKWLQNITKISLRDNDKKCPVLKDCEMKLVKNGLTIEEQTGIYMLIEWRIID
jgi:hypothetical protein